MLLNSSPNCATLSETIHSTARWIRNLCYAVAVASLALLAAASAKASIFLTTDSPSAWKGTGTDLGLGSSWNTDLNYDDSGWGPAYDVYQLGFPDGLGAVRGIWWAPVPDVTDNRNGWFRAKLNIDGTLINPRLIVFFDDAGEFYLNGIELWHDGEGVAISYYDNNPLTQDTDLVKALPLKSEYLHTGENLFAFHVYDTASGFNYGMLRLSADGIEHSETTPTPEPASLSIWGLGALGFAAAGYRRRKLSLEPQRNLNFAMGGIVLPVLVSCGQA